jgi:cytochrome P450
MKEMVAAKKTALQSEANGSSTIDFMGQLVKGQEEQKDGKSQDPVGFSDSEVMGNLFVIAIAGHETSANSIHFSLLLLALYPEAQRKVQQELAEIFQGRPISEWDYDRDIPRLMCGMLGAVLNEQLRLIAPTISVPKDVRSAPQQLIVEDKVVTVPANTIVRVSIPAVHRNPKFWPHGQPKNPQKPRFALDNLDNDLEEFKPERWLKRGDETPDTAADLRTTDSKITNTRHLSANTATETPASLYTPVKGSYIPFSDGQRACLGKRFAQVEILAALAVILTQRSVELAVDEWATDEEVEQMTRDQRRDTWNTAEEKAQWILQNKMGAMITLQLRGAHVPVRFVRRGEERFWDV